jgi:hypothetical protein
MPIAPLDALLVAIMPNTATKRFSVVIKGLT